MSRSYIVRKHWWGADEKQERVRQRGHKVGTFAGLALVLLSVEFHPHVSTYKLRLRRSRWTCALPVGPSMPSA